MVPPPSSPAAASVPLYRQAVDFAGDVLTGRSRLAVLVPPALLALDAALCGLVIWKVPYTEIDWIAYMEQVAQIVAGERDYTQIAGGTGPLVYPAAHVYTYTALFYATDAGRNVLLAQQLFAGIYLAALALAMACYWRAGAPPYVFPLLVLSKRLHSIFMLRCFNDGVAALCLWASLFCFQRRLWALGLLAYAWGLGTKMTLLLGLPAVGLVLVLGRGVASALKLALLLAQVQFLLGTPFLVANARGYVGRAFELSRVFFFRWTVNWRFVGEDVFLSRPFALGLLAVHVALLALFAITRWLRPATAVAVPRASPSLSSSPSSSSSAGVVLSALAARVTRAATGAAPFSPAEEAVLTQRAATPRYVLTTVLTATLVGLLAARSLHYQFYAYLAWTTPYLLWRSGVHPVVQYALWAAQEWAWNVFPSTSASSAVVVAVMAVTVALVWWGAVDEYAPVLPAASSATAPPAESDTKKEQ